MGIESNLRKEGIKVTEELDKIKVNTIAKNVAQKIVAAFPELDFKLGEVFITFSIKNVLCRSAKGLFRS